MLRRRTDETTIPALSVEVPSVRADSGRLLAYRALCGYDGGHLPVTYPQVQAAPLQLHLLTRREFPLPLLGVVHVRNTIRQYRALDPAKSYRLRVALQPATVVPSGIEFPLLVRYYDGQILVWEATATGLCRRRRRGTGGSHASAAQQVEGFESCATFDVPSDIGRRYGRLSGDLNPIHLWPIAGRLFGYPSHIAHALWSVARCLALLQRDGPASAVEIQFEVKQPLFLPSHVSLWRRPAADALEFALTTSDLGRIHVRGSIRPIAAPGIGVHA
jgi:acyl dehydratase